MTDALCTAEKSLVMISPPPDGVASGVVVGHSGVNSYVLTCKHVVEKVDSAEIETEDHKMQAKVHRLHRSADLAIVRTSERLEAPYITLAKEAPERYDEAFMLACPAGEWAVPARGIVGRYDEDAEVLQITMPSIGGCSGAPIVNHEGELIGILSHGLMKNGQELSDYSYAVPIDVIRRFVSRALR